jgi:N-acyl-D-amino-acid deacylase
MVTAASALSLGASAAAQTAPARFDIVIAGGRVLDGSGNPAYRADVGIVGDRVSAIGDLSRAPASQRIDAAGKLVAPGFIDLHSHAFEATGPSGTRSAIDDQPARLAAPNLVGQGVTTVVINQDGRSPWPLRDQSASFSRLGTGVNVLQLIGHGAVRGRVMGEDVRRAARPDEVQKMRALVRQGMQEGAFGLSSGLEYAPGRWSTTDELVALTEEVVPFRGIYISHERSDGTDPMWYWPSRTGRELRRCSMR